MFLARLQKIRPAGALVLCSFLLKPPDVLFSESVSVHLQADSGIPLRLYVTKRIRYRKDEPVAAKLVEPVWSFDRIVLPAGTIVHGQVDELRPVPKLVRAMAMLRGDFTPLKQARVSFSDIQMPDGKLSQVDTQPSFGLASIYDPGPPKKSKRTKKSPKPTNAVYAQARKILDAQAQGRVDARTHGLFGLVRAPNKRDWLENFLWSKLPYHPQWYRKGTRFDAVLREPIDFGQAIFNRTALDNIGSQPPPDSVGLVRFLSTVSSKDAQVGDQIAGVLSAPLFSSNHKLLLPEGTHLNGKVTRSRGARFFHRGGELRFAFDEVQPPHDVLPVERPGPVQTQLTAVEQTSGTVQVDKEGLAKATESKTRFLRPAIAGIIAAKSADNDTGKQTASGGASANNNWGTALGGFSGFGLFGTAVAQGPSFVGAALGYYGLAWSVYATVISRGREVVFEKNGAMAIRFGARREAR